MTLLLEPCRLLGVVSETRPIDQRPRAWKRCGGWRVASGGDGDRSMHACITAVRALRMRDKPAHSSKQYPSTSAYPSSQPNASHSPSWHVMAPTGTPGTSWQLHDSQLFARARARLWTTSWRRDALGETHSTPCLAGLV